VFRILSRLIIMSPVIFSGRLDFGPFVFVVKSFSYLIQCGVLVKGKFWRLANILNLKPFVEILFPDFSLVLYISFLPISFILLRALTVFPKIKFFPCHLMINSFGLMLFKMLVCKVKSSSSFLISICII